MNAAAVNAMDDASRRESFGGGILSFFWLDNPIKF